MSHRFLLWCSLYVVGICRYIYYFSVKFFHQLLFFSYNISLGVAVDEFFVVFMLGKYADSISKLYVALSVFSQEIADDQKMWLLLWGTSKRSKNKKKCFIHLWQWVGIFSKHKNRKSQYILLKIIFIYRQTTFYIFGQLEWFPFLRCWLTSESFCIWASYKNNVGRQMMVTFGNY